MQVKSNAVYFTGAFCNTFDMHYAIICPEIIGLENLFFSVFFEWPLKRVLLITDIKGLVNLQKNFFKTPTD